MGKTVVLYQLPGPDGSEYVPDPGTEGGRFSSRPMCTDLTGECARKFLADLEDPIEREQRGKKPGKGPDSVLRDIASGRMTSSVYTPEEAQRTYLELAARSGRGGPEKES